MKLLPFALFGALVPFVTAQNETILAELVQAFQSAGLTSLVNLTSTLNSTGVGQYLLANITNGNPHLLFAPNNDARMFPPSPLHTFLYIHMLTILHF